MSADAAAAGATPSKTNQLRASASPFRGREAASPAAGFEHQSCTIFVGNLPSHTPYNELHAVLSEFGELARLEIYRRPVPTQESDSFSFAFAEFPHVEDALRAIKELHNSLFCGHKIRVATARRPEQASPAVPAGRNNLFVSNLPDNMTMESVFGIFARFGRVVSCRTKQVAHKERKGTPRRAALGTIAFVRMENEQQALAAMHDLNGLAVPGMRSVPDPEHGDRIIVRFAHEKHTRAQQHAEDKRPADEGKVACQCLSPYLALDSLPPAFSPVMPFPMPSPPSRPPPVVIPSPGRSPPPPTQLLPASPAPPAPRRH